MTSHSLMPHSAAQSGSVFAAKVSRTSPLQVTLDAYGTAHEYPGGTTAATWLGAGRVPVRGSRVLAVFDDTFAVWVLPSDAPSVASRATRTATQQSIPTGVWTAIDLDTEDATADPDAMHSTTLNPSRFTCVTPGLFACSGSTLLALNATGVRLAAWIKNRAGTAVYSGTQGTPHTATINPYLSSTAHIPMIAGDYVEFCVFQDSGVALNTAVTTAVPSIGSVVLVGRQT